MYCMGTSTTEGMSDWERRRMHNGERGYHVMFVGPQTLPQEQDFVFLECGGEVWLAIRRDRLTVEVLEDAWTAYRAAEAVAV